MTPSPSVPSAHRGPAADATGGATREGRDARSTYIVGNRVETESRMGVESLEALLDDRTRLVAEVADLRALFGSFGTWDHRRKIELARLSGEIRARLKLAGDVKVTEALLDEEAHAHPAYMQFIIDATRKRAEWTILENKIQNINDTILRDNAIARFASSEMHLR